MKTLPLFTLTLILTSFSTLVKADTHSANPKKAKKHGGHFSLAKPVYHDYGYYIIYGEPIYDYNMDTPNYSLMS